MSVNQRDDRALVRAFQKGDQVAFEQLVRRHQDRLFRLATAWLRDHALAADAVQEVFMRAVGGLRRFRFGAEPFTWLYRTLRNVCRELNRGKVSEHYEDHADPAGTPESMAIETDELARMQRLVDGLAERQREVVYLRIFEGLDTATTAKTMGCRPGTVKALLNQARSKLAEQWQ